MPVSPLRGGAAPGGPSREFGTVIRFGGPGGSLLRVPRSFTRFARLFGDDEHLPREYEVGIVWNLQRFPVRLVEYPPLEGIPVDEIVLGDAPEESLRSGMRRTR